MRAFEAVCSTPWAIQEPVLRTILEIAARENLSPEAVAAKLGRPLNHTRTVQVRDGVAVVPVIGPVFRYANMFTEISGATSTQVLATDFRTSLEDPQVKGILLEIDSPGGEAHGIQEVAQMIYEARRKKPVVAYVSGNGGSAAYWLASAASEIVLSSTSAVGSIGVVAAFRDTKARDEREGVRSIEFVSTQSPNKRPDLDTDEGKAQVQQMIDAVADVFVTAVARNRGVGKRAVLHDFGGGGMLVGQAAVEAGMADRLGSFEQTLADVIAMNGYPRKRKKNSDSGMAADDPAEMTATSEEQEMAELETVKADLAAAQSKITALEAKAEELGGELKAATERANDADARSAKAEGLAKVGIEALADLKTEYLENRIRLGQGGAEGQEIANLLESQGNYARLKQLRDETRAQVLSTIRSGASADVTSATDGGQDADQELTAAEVSIIQSNATRTGRSLAECKKSFLEAKASRANRGLLR